MPANRLRQASVLALVLAAGLVAVWAIPAESQDAHSSATTRQLLKRIKLLERQVNALTVLQERSGVKVETSYTTPSSIGNGYYYGTAACARGHASGGGVQIPFGGVQGDGIISSYPGGAGWSAYFRSRSTEIPQIWVVCIR